MIKLLLIADDFTGVLDSGAQFSKLGVNTMVSTSMDISTSGISDDVEVLAISSDTRHCSPEEAYNIIYNLVKQASLNGIEYIYKKTDSVLRGNIGAELTAFKDASKKNSIDFIPAYPEFNRLTINGVQMLNGVPVDMSTFANDPFSPVKSGIVRNVIAQQSDVPVTNCTLDSTSTNNGIHVYDCASEEEMQEIGALLKKQGRLNYVSGCAGFATVLAKLIDFNYVPKKKSLSTKKLLIVSGSVNSITIEQLNYIEQKKISVVVLQPHQKLTMEAISDVEENVAKAIKYNNIAVIATTDEQNNLDKTTEYAIKNSIELPKMRLQIMDNIGKITKESVQNNNVDTLMIIGGDTLKGVLKEFHCSGIIPYGEIDNGTVFGEMILPEKNLKLITKSGGLGDREILWKVISSCFAEEL